MSAPAAGQSLRADEHPLAQLAKQLALEQADARSTAEVLKELRQMFPDMPLSERVAVLAVLAALARR
jgi:hypothetical protein